MKCITVFECQVYITGQFLAHLRLTFDGYLALLPSTIYYLDWEGGCIELPLDNTPTPYINPRDGAHEFGYWFADITPDDLNQAELIRAAFVKNGWKIIGNHPASIR